MMGKVIVDIIEFAVGLSLYASDGNIIDGPGSWRHPGQITLSRGNNGMNRSHPTWISLQKAQKQS
jgi:hypothetical protein